MRCAPGVALAKSSTPNGFEDRREESPAGSGRSADVPGLVSPSNFFSGFGNPSSESRQNSGVPEPRRVPKTKTYGSAVRERNPRSLFPLSERDPKYVSRCFGPRSLDASRVARRQSFARVRGTYAVALNQFLRKERVCLPWRPPRRSPARRLSTRLAWVRAPRAEFARWPSRRRVVPRSPSPPPWRVTMTSSSPPPLPLLLRFSTPLPSRCAPETPDLALAA
jgi:hypothetical protein